MKTLKISTAIMIATLLLLVNICSAARVVKQGGSVYIQDRTGERWDVTQAQTLGFKPHKFQYGIGKNAFTPLQDEDFNRDRVSSFYNTRVIGVTLDDTAHAYTVDRLKHHETANTTIAGKAIVAGY
jgi:hypothetical protein